MASAGDPSLPLYKIGERRRGREGRVVLAAIERPGRAFALCIGRMLRCARDHFPDLFDAIFLFGRRRANDCFFFRTGFCCGPCFPEVQRRHDAVPLEPRVGLKVRLFSLQRNTAHKQTW